MAKKPKDKKAEIKEEKEPEIFTTSETGKIISEDIKAEIYQIAEIVLEEKVREFNRRIGELELENAKQSQRIAELDESVSELRSDLKKQKIGSAEQLVGISEKLGKISGNVSALEKTVIENLDEVQSALGKRKR